MSSFRQGVSLVLSAALVMSTTLAACGGGGGGYGSGGGSASPVTGTGDLQGVYSLSDIAAAARIEGLDATGSNVYLVVDTPYVAFYGKDGSCFDLGTINAESLGADGAVTADVAFQSDLAIAPSCIATLQSDYGFRVKENGLDRLTLQIIFLIAANQLRQTQLVDLFFLQWVAVKLRQAILSGHADTLTIQTAFTLIAAALVAILNNPAPTAEPTTTPAGPAIVDQCTGVTHGSGRSWVRGCILAAGLLQGAEFGFQFGSGLPARAFLNAALIACYDFVITSYAKYSWSAFYAHDTSVATTGNIAVGKTEQDCSLAPFADYPVGTMWRERGEARPVAAAHEAP